MPTESKLFVKAKQGMTIRRLDNLKPVSSDGEFVPNDSYYRRAIAAGDLEVCKEPKDTPAKSTGTKDN